MTKNPMLDRLVHQSKQSKGYHQSKVKEKKLALRLGGRTTLASGSKNEKGDVRLVGVARIEHKITQRKSFSVTRDMIQKVVNASAACEEIAAIVIDFIDPDTGKSDGEMAVISMFDLQRLIQNAK